MKFESDTDTRNCMMLSYRVNYRTGLDTIVKSNYNTTNNFSEYLKNVLIS